MGSQPLVTLIALGALALLPFAFMIASSFVKISVVFSILRNALGTGQVPSGVIITALSALLSLFVMTPVAEDMMDAASPAVARIDTEQPLRGDSSDAVVDALQEGAVPLRAFLERNAGAREHALFYDLARRARRPERRDEVQRADLLVVEGDPTVDLEALQRVRAVVARGEVAYVAR